MRNRWFRRFLLVCLCFICLPCVAQATYAAESEVVLATPTYEELGGGFYAISVPVESYPLENLLPTLNTGDAKEKAKSQTFFVLAAGQSPNLPLDPTNCVHVGISNINQRYFYWVMVVNLGSQNLARTVNFKLSGPGLSFNHSMQTTYRANGIWLLAYTPGVGVDRSGIYTLQVNVVGSGSAVARTWAVAF
jgi:hypothetical protein